MLKNVSLAALAQTDVLLRQFLPVMLILSMLPSASTAALVQTLVL